MEDYKKFCLEQYQAKYDESYSSGADFRDAQRNAIRATSIEAINKFPTVEPAQIWSQIYIAHVYNKSGITDREVIKAIISANNSWMKSSGHAFEGLIKEVGNLYLNAYDIEILLQKELNILLKANAISNEVRDISWLKEQIQVNIFDLYLAINKGDEKYIYGCVQSKTSVRDRVTRDREPSINAMNAFFMSIAIVLNGAFLKLPKFKNMVNGNSKEYEINGWHALYVMTNENMNDGRIHTMGLDMEILVEHCVKGAEFWLTQRQWLNSSWNPND